MINKEKLVDELLEMLKANGYLYNSDIGFYYDNLRKINDDDGNIIIEKVNINDYIDEYLKDEEFIIYMTFEGVFYDVMHYGTDNKFKDKFVKHINSNGLYYDYGNYWNIVIKEF